MNSIGALLLTAPLLLSVALVPNAAVAQQSGSPGDDAHDGRFIRALPSVSAQATVSNTGLGIQGNQRTSLFTQSRLDFRQNCPWQ